MTPAPLSGQRIVVTRAAHQAEELAAPLRELGADVILLPTIAIVPPADRGPLERALSQIAAYDWIVFTSANSVAAVGRPGNIGKTRAAAIGSATREAAERAGWRIDLTPAEYVAESLIEAFRGEDLQGKRVLIPCAAVTRDLVPAALREQGAEVEVVIAYRNMVPEDAMARAGEAFAHPPDWVVFASSSAVNHLMAAVGPEKLAEVRLASIGPATSATIRSYGLRVAAEPEEHTIPGLVEAIAAHGSDRSGKISRREAVLSMAALLGVSRAARAHQLQPGQLPPAPVAKPGQVESPGSQVGRPRELPREKSTFSADVKVVNLLATVRNKKGEMVRDLNKEDFTLFEDGRPQAIRYFARESDLPLTLGLMVDTSMSQQKVLNAERSASFRFLDQVLREQKDHAFLIQFDMSVRMPQALTSSLKQLEDALAYVDTPSRKELRHQSGGGTLLYDAVVSSSTDVMKKQQGRKALILLTDGVDTGSNTTLNEAVEAAQRADTLIYSILFSDEGAYGGFSDGPDGRDVLQRLSRETGGGFFEVSKKLKIEQIFGLIEVELRNQYSIGYISDQPATIAGFRKVQLAAKQPGLIVQTRDEYWAQP